MELGAHVRNRRWTTVSGYGLFVALMVAGYYYNITFVQLGLIDLGTRLVGLTETAVSMWMAALALCTLVVAVTTGVTMDRRGWSTGLRTKLRLLFGVVCVQFALTLVAPMIRTVPGFGGWIVLASIGLGVGFPVSFSLAIDLVPVPDRGYVAAAITAIAYFLANAIPLSWSVDVFSQLMVAAMAPGIVVLGVLSFVRVGRLESILDALGTQHETYGTGRFCHGEPVRARSLAFTVPVVLMFGVFFIDSLGFLRIIDTPSLLLSSWQSPDLSTRLFIAVAHVVGAVMAGVIYANYSLSRIFLWTFALFALTHVMYTSDLRFAAVFPAIAGDGTSPLNPALYAIAVSFYTTLNFALWPDLSTPETIGTHSAIGIGVAGWLATFSSTALALYFQAVELTLLSHLNVVQALSLLLLFGLVVGLYAKRMVELASENGGAST
ncbi:multidrug effflux MFS transporter [Halorubellus sp. JP-L1]|uniref:multidrug effflux MFS transporter n=1 Tax=Halorubellus sp. JP-L1 TaxID=2715753 RepID=UPI0014084B24|nr:multidrug effflux MFS transporter [Halorubellus sp. JP-L1]NHN42975.1 multidrug effflux MFS transporter [Halorubellus sp. JP-L1]